MRFTIALVMLLASFSVSAKTLLVSDVDDTIKLANIPNKFHAAKYAIDDESRFAGMAQLYNIIRKDNEEISIAYLSNAPTWLMQETHKELLINGNFPRAPYYGRSEYASEVHKITWLRKLILSEKPDDVILVGDNTERDPEIYEQIRSEFATSGIRFHTYIRVITDAPVPKDQVKFVTPIEVSFELEKNGLITSESVDWMMSYVAPYLAAQKLDLAKGNVAFPYFIACQTFTWQREWNQRAQSFPVMQDLKTKIAIRCGN
ncbi:hypothetical protein D3C87_260630 [compost metagenome]